MLTDNILSYPVLSCPVPSLPFPSPALLTSLADQCRLLRAGRTLEEGGRKGPVISRSCWPPGRVRSSSSSPGALCSSAGWVGPLTQGHSLWTSHR